MQLALQVDSSAMTRINLFRLSDPLTIKVITGFRTYGTIHLSLQRHSSDDLHTRDHRSETHTFPELPWMAALINFPTAVICQIWWEVCTDYAGYAICE